MNPFLQPWLKFMEGMNYGDLNQAIAPVTTWFSPQYEFNFAGNPRLEKKIVADGASYGKQLGILSEAVLELANGKKGNAVGRLKEMVSRIDRIKGQDTRALEEDIKDRLEQLKQRDDAALKRVLRQYGDK
jgi:uncharacterized protein (UPF0335 family)